MTILSRACAAFLFLFHFAAASWAAPAVCPADFPSKPIQWIVPWPPGGGADGLARTLQEALSGQLRGQALVIDNRPGAGGNIGAAAAARATPDGYTLLLASASTHAINPSLYSNLPFAESDFAAVSKIANVSNVLLVNPSLPVHSVQELVDYLKSHEVDYASSGNGSIQHLASELFQQGTGTRMTHIPYRGGGPAVIATIAGETQVMIADPIAALPQVQAGKLRALGTTGQSRTVSLPDLPTLSEAGIADYDANSWIGLLAPKGTPGPVISCLNAALHAVLDTPAIREKLLSMGYEPDPDTPEAFQALISSEIVNWGEVVKQAGITVD